MSLAQKFLAFNLPGAQSSAPIPDHVHSGSTAQPTALTTTHSHAPPVHSPTPNPPPSAAPYGTSTSRASDPYYPSSTPSTTTQYTPPEAPKSVNPASRPIPAQSYYHQEATRVSPNTYHATTSSSSPQPVTTHYHTHHAATTEHTLRERNATPGGLHYSGGAAQASSVYGSQPPPHTTAAPPLSTRYSHDPSTEYPAHYKAAPPSSYTPASAHQDWYSQPHGYGHAPSTSNGYAHRSSSHPPSYSTSYANGVTKVSYSAPPHHSNPPPSTYPSTYPAYHTDHPAHDVHPPRYPLHHAPHSEYSRHRSEHHHPSYYHSSTHYASREHPEPYAREPSHTGSWIHPSSASYPETYSVKPSYPPPTDLTGRYSHHHELAPHANGHHVVVHPYGAPNNISGSYQPPPATADASLPPLPVPANAHPVPYHGNYANSVTMSPVNTHADGLDKGSVALNKRKVPLIALPRRAKSPTKKGKKLRNLTALPPPTRTNIKTQDRNGSYSETSPLSASTPTTAGGKRGKKGSKRKRSSSKPESQDSDENFELRTTRATKRQKTLASKKASANKGPAAKARKKKKSAKRRSELSIFDNYVEYPAPPPRADPTEVHESSNFVFSNVSFDMFVDSVVSYNDSMQWLQDNYVERSTESATRRYDDKVVPTHLDIKRAYRFMEWNLRHCLNQKELQLRSPNPEARGSWYPKDISPGDRQVLEDIKTGRGTDVFEILCMSDMLRITEDDVAEDFAVRKVEEIPDDTSAALLSSVKIATYTLGTQNVKTKRVEAVSYNLDASEIETDLLLLGPPRARKSKKRRAPSALTGLRKDMYEKISDSGDEEKVVPEEPQDVKEEEEPQNETMEEIDEEEEQADEYVPPEANLEPVTRSSHYEGRSLRSTRATRSSKSDNEQSPQPPPVKEERPAGPTLPKYGDTDYTPPKSLASAAGVRKFPRRQLRPTRDKNNDQDEGEAVSIS